MSKKITIKRALLSCWDKTALAELAQQLVQQKVEIISSGGTAAFLSQQGIAVRKIEEIIGFKEILNGRVKTLHPAIHAAILAKRTKDHLRQLQANGIVPIDLVVVNLYPFLDFMDQAKPLTEMIELIDIGGPAMLRAAAKNYSHVAVLHHPDQYRSFLETWKRNHYSLPLEFTLQLAADTFFHTSYYDAQINRFFDSLANQKELPVRFAHFHQKYQELRYGENPHQAAAFYLSVDQFRKNVPIIEQLWGKEMSYNNYLDVTAAAAVVREFAEPAATIVKHSNPCGAAIDSQLVAAFDKALAGDPLSAFGGIVATNRKIDHQLAEHIQQTFFECVLAPDYSIEALNILKKKKNLRILKSNVLFKKNEAWDFRHLPAGMLVQKPDLLSYEKNKLQSVGVREPSPEEKRDLLFAWKIVQQVKSNAIVFAKDLKIVGVGAGQMSRVDSVKIACRKAKENGHNLQGAVMASDAFFPFRDGLDEAAAAGITAVIQPGGSMRDPEVIEAARQYQMSMLFTGIRHFKH
jgi:phosphoribosylaminoimidazolecarboxamide formyltransferase/IMP cyclohydrolase